MQDTESNESTISSPAAAPSVAPSLVETQLAQLRKLFTATLLALLLIGFGLDLYLLRQVMTMRKDLEAARPTAMQLFDNSQKEKPQIQYFIGSLQAYARTHPEFAPIFNKYTPALTQLGLVASSPAAAIPAAASPLGMPAAPAAPATPVLK